MPSRRNGEENRLKKKKKDNLRAALFNALRALGELNLNLQDQAGPLVEEPLPQPETKDDDDHMEAENETEALLRAVDEVLGLEMEEAACQTGDTTLPEMESFLGELDELLADGLAPRSSCQAGEDAEISASPPAACAVDWAMAETQQEEEGELDDIYTLQITAEESDLNFD